MEYEVDILGLIRRRDI